MGVARLYKAGTPYNAADLRELDFEQTADVMYFAHLNYQLEKMTRFGHTDWRFTTVTFGPTIAAPGAPPTVSPHGSGTIQYHYVTTAINDATGQESRASGSASAANDLSISENYNTIVSATVTGATRYIFYKSESGPDSSFGYIGASSTPTFDDRNIAANLADTPPIGQNPFVGAGNYPSTVTFNQQRLMVGRTINKPNGIWGSQSADFENMDTSRPAKEDDAIVFALVAGRVNSVNQLASMKTLLALTSDAVFSIDGGGTGSAITPANIVSVRQTGRGSSRLGPLVIDNVVFFRPSQGSSVRTLGYTFQLDGYESNNIAIFSPHFFDGFDIVAWAYQQEPYACVWAVRDDGKLLCCTWEQEQQVWGWSIHDLGGFVLDVCTITEDGMDRLYLAVRRTLAGHEDVFIERMALPLLVSEDLPYACHLDCAVSQVFDTPTKTVGQLFHLEGETVTAYYDGNVTTGLVVTNATVTLPYPGTIVTVGLPYSGQIETLPLALQGQGSKHTQRQMMAKAIIRVEKTRGLRAGAGGGSMFDIKQRQGEALGTPIQLHTGDFYTNLSASWNDGSTLIVRQDYPLPATISAVFVEPVITQ